MMMMIMMIMMMMMLMMMMMIHPFFCSWTVHASTVEHHHQVGWPLQLGRGGHQAWLSQA